LTYDVDIKDTVTEAVSAMVPCFFSRFFYSLRLRKLAHSSIKIEANPTYHNQPACNPWFAAQSSMGCSCVCLAILWRSVYEPTINLSTTLSTG